MFLALVLTGIEVEVTLFTLSRCWIE